VQLLLWLDLDGEAKVRDDTVVVAGAVLTWWAPVENLWVRQSERMRSRDEARKTYVLGFEISVHDAARSEVGNGVLFRPRFSLRSSLQDAQQAHRQGIGHLPRLLLAKPPHINQMLVQLSSRRELKHEVELVPRFEPFPEMNDVRVY